MVKMLTTCTCHLSTDPIENYWDQTINIYPKLLQFLLRLVICSFFGSDSMIVACIECVNNFYLLFQLIKLENSKDLATEQTATDIS